MTHLNLAALSPAQQPDSDKRRPDDSDVQTGENKMTEQTMTNRELVDAAIELAGDFIP